MLPDNVRRAIHKEVKRLVDELGIKQTEIARKIGVTQGMVAKVYNRPEIGIRTAEKFFEVYGSKEELLTRHRERAPAPETDMLVREFVDWLEGTPAIKTVARRPDVTVKDLLRVKMTPPRGGEADPERVYAHILQLRAGEVGGLPSSDRTARPLEAEMRRQYRKGAKE